MKNSRLIVILGIVLAICGAAFAEAPASPEPSPAPAPEKEIQLFQWRPDVSVLLVHPIVVETLRARLGIAELENRLRQADSNLSVTQAYLNKLMERTTALEKALAEKAAVGKTPIKK